jgi:polyisoprenoid-binding protein YceI
MTNRTILGALALLSIAVLLSACGGPSPTPEVPPATEVVEAEAPTAEVAEATTAPETAEETTMESGVLLLKIRPEDSEARFIIDEELRGAPKTVVGVTNEVSGEIQVDPTEPAAAVIGPIQIAAGNLTTDNDFRNRAIRTAILQTAQYEFITFAPTDVSGLPEVVSVGDSFDIQVSGDLTIRDITLPVTFDVTITVVSDSSLEGSARTVIERSDFNLTIPSVPQVANVSEQVGLEFDFLASAE